MSSYFCWATDVGTKDSADKHDGKIHHGVESSGTPPGIPDATTDNYTKIATVTSDISDKQTKFTSCSSISEFLQSLSLRGLVGSGSKVTKSDNNLPFRSYQDALRSYQDAPRSYQDVPTAPANGENCKIFAAPATNSAELPGTTEIGQDVLADELEEFRQSIMVAKATSTDGQTPDSGGTTSSTDTTTEPPEEVDVPLPPPPHLTARNIESKRLEARRRDHCLFHRSLCSPDTDCAGCLAKTRNKSHYKHSFDRKDERYSNTITLDQMGFGDYSGTKKKKKKKSSSMAPAEEAIHNTDADDLPTRSLGIGGYRYGIVLCKVMEDHWTFQPLKTMDSKEAERIFREFCGQIGRTDEKSIKLLTVYCDAHASLRAVCTEYGLSVAHPPPGRPQANSEIERRIGVALNGLRAYLAQAGLPNCFWPLAGHCYSVNYCAKPKRPGAKSSYEEITGNKFNMKDSGRTFIFGELVFFKPAPTIEVTEKPGSTLQPGVFLDYYMNWRGEFTGQYIVCPLEDFVGTSLYHRAEAKSFKLRLHRTEVCRLPTNLPETPVSEMDLPIFPLRRKFHEQNNTLEGLEQTKTLTGNKMGDPTKDLDMARCPEPKPDDTTAIADEVKLDDPLYKYNARGFRLRVDAQNKWLRTEEDPRGFRPESFSSHEWNRLSPEEKEMSKDRRELLRKLSKGVDKRSRGKQA